MKNLEEKITQLTRKLEAAYAAGGKAALDSMRVGEVGLLLSEKQIDYAGSVTGCANIRMMRSALAGKGSSKRKSGN